MSLIRLDKDYRSPQPTAVCLGTFDGVHLGHRALIGACREEAARRGLLPAAFVFERPPISVIHPEARTQVLTPLEDKRRLLEDLGIRDVIYAVFSEAFSGMTCERFFYGVLLEQLRAGHLVCGFHYRFGKGAAGNAEILKELCRENGITLEVIPPVKTSEGELISSSAIRQYLEHGNRDAAEEMLGRPLLHTEEKLLGGVRYGESS